ncbi:bacteriocin immunity protein [Lactobacillus nasalidis]|uniref:Bacteriocin immunity protein n=1 Tax=Lactobacillus nasalidis TaxID=2797258 RepID=A0ABQ3W8I1_9LACO|nr:bacteriocin immunity protein [Lactobacillus nasalidis]GHV97040.1 bacteriocin immunity protein [Lactobacillus nasalidis]GHW00269.1 bacteriocin immunity protein [Lactobacillus nasalidis]GHW01735.1 bacteriocin immunity protein [Lactobacillus nasalidis]
MQWAIFSNFLQKNRQESDRARTQQILKNFYASFFSDIYNERNISRYKPLRDAIALVLGRFDSGDHPMEYAAKLALYLPAKASLNRLRFTKEQQGWLKELSRLTRQVSLNFVYLSPLDSISQFSL